MPFYRKKPVVIEAMEFTQDSKLKVFDWVTCEKRATYGIDGLVELEIETLEGRMIARLGDFIIKGVKGECYPCKPDIFWATYSKMTNGFSDTRGPDVG